VLTEERREIKHFEAGRGGACKGVVEGQLVHATLWDEE
jgi:hypothetical protein